LLQKAVPLQPISNFAIVIAQTIASKLEVGASVRDASELRLNKRKFFADLVRTGTAVRKQELSKNYSQK